MGVKIVVGGFEIMGVKGAEFLAGASESNHSPIIAQAGCEAWILGLFAQGDADSGFVRAGLEDSRHGVPLGGGYPELILVFDGNLAGDILTAKGLVWW